MGLSIGNTQILNHVRDEYVYIHPLPDLIHIVILNYKKLLVYLVLNFEIYVIIISSSLSINEEMKMCLFGIELMITCFLAYLSNIKSKYEYKLFTSDKDNIVKPATAPSHCHP